MGQHETIVLCSIIICCIFTIFNRKMTPIVMPVVILVLFVGLSNNISTNNAVSAKKAQTDAKDPEKKVAPLPQTVNPRHKKPEVPEDATTKVGAGNDSNKNANNAQSEARIDNRTHVFQYTPQGMQAKLDERQFRRIDPRETRDGRARFLDALYQELLDSSVKGDPALRIKNDDSDGCEPLRGRTKPYMF